MRTEPDFPASSSSEERSLTNWLPESCLLGSNHLEMNSITREARTDKPCSRKHTRGEHADSRQREGRAACTAAVSLGGVSWMR